MVIDRPVIKCKHIFFLKTSKLPATFLLLFTLLQPFIVKAQIKSSKWRTAEDSLIMVRKQFSRWHSYGGLHLSSDAELFYLGPSFQAGLDFNPNPYLVFSTYIHYFYAGVNNKYTSGLTERGRIRTFTSAFLVQLDAGAGWYKGFFIGGGLAVQQYADRFTGMYGSYDNTRTSVTPVIRTGYLFPAGLLSLAIEFNGTGPYSYDDGPYGRITEVFTQVSAGVRYVF